MATSRVVAPRIGAPVQNTAITPAQGIDFGQYIPGFNSLTGTASKNIGNLLNASAMPDRDAIARAGVSTGMGPLSGVSNFAGYDIGKKQAKADQAMGLEQLMAMLTGYSGTVAPTTGEQQRGSEFDRELAFRQRESDAANSLAQQRLDVERQRISPGPQGNFRQQISPGPVPGGFTNRAWWA
jgi:hypothetical protein